MATVVGDCVEDLASGHDEVYDWTCGQCEETGNITEAIAYCRDCDEAYCDPCRKIHGRFPAMKNHKVLDDTQKGSWGNDTGTRGSTHPCPDHDGQTISMFCGDHDILCCPVCVSLDHRLCGDMAYIPMISKDIATSQEFLKTQDDISLTITETNEIMQDAEEAQTILDDSSTIAREQICETKQQVIEHFDKLEEKAISAVDKLHESLENELNEMSYCLADSFKGLGIFSQRLKPDDSVRDSELFVLMKMSQKKVLECHSVGQQVKRKTSREQFKITFDANPEVRAIHAIATLGHLGNTKKKVLYTLSEEFQCNLEMQHEKYYTTVCGMYRFSNGNILLSDQPNNKLKLLNSRYKIIDSCKLPCPSQICCVNETEPAEIVVASIDGSLQFLSVSDKITPSMNIKLNHKCNGLVYCKGRFYISDLSQQVHIYTVSGKKMKLVKTTAKDKEGNQLFGDPQDIALKYADVANATDAIYIADGKKGIVVLDLDGNHLITMNPNNIGTCFKAVPDQIGNIFALNNDKCLLQLGEKGETIIGILEKNAKQCFLDAESSKLYVWCCGDKITSIQYLKIFKP